MDIRQGIIFPNKDITVTDKASKKLSPIECAHTHTHTSYIGLHKYKHVTSAFRTCSPNYHFGK